MSSTRLHLELRFRGETVDPAEITRLTGVEPSRSFTVGEAHGRSEDVKGWDWTSASADQTEGPLQEMLRLFGPLASALRAWQLNISPTANTARS
jgi:hypothetical protein